MKKKKWAALVLCLLLVVQTALPAAGAAESVYFVAAGNEVLPLSDETMPFWSNGFLYVAASIFSGSVRQSLGISYTGTSQTAILYSAGDHSLIFDLHKNYAEDSGGGVSYPGALRRGGVTFVPAYLVAKYFGLTYSVMEVEHGQLVWLRQSGMSLTDKQFANAAVYPCAVSYNEYLKKKNSASSSEQKPPEEEVSDVQKDGKSIYLCIEAGENTDTLLDVLERAGVQATFFCTPEFIKSHGGAVRRMTACGMGIGLLGRSGQAMEDLAEGAAALRQATCGGTRLAMIPSGTDEELRAAQAAGYSCVQPRLDRSGYALKSESGAQSLLRRVSALRGSAVVWLGGSVNGTGLRAFAALAQEAESHCLGLTETA